jgi:predicted HAD superfamily Cof-like phosphohydrolase
MFNRVAAFHRAFGHPIGELPNFPKQHVRNLRINLIGEELEEYCAAFAVGDRVKMADGLGDTLYVLAGTAVAYGIAPQTIFESPYETPFQKVLFPEEPELHYEIYLREAFGQYLHAEQENDLDAVKESILDMMDRVFNVARLSNIPINVVFDEIHRSNLSKLMPDGSVLYRADNKVLKGPNYTPPDIASIMQQAYSYA